ncbi:MAG: AMIN domain-containing protein [Tildeniella nuda ZEHNDER 1965/U140]|nr:AMIN domain-containing protein [Tildeniella nuda ZEHNDER 1965/U140]
MQSQKFESRSHPERRSLPIQSAFIRRLLAASIAALNAVATEATVLSVQAASLTNWNFDPAVNQLEITVKDGTTPRYFLMAQPARIVVDLPDTAVGAVSAQKTYAGAVRQIRVSQFEPGLTRIVMEISPGVSLAPGQVKLQKIGNDAARSGNSRWLLQPLITKSFSANAVAVKPLAPNQSRTRAIVPIVPATKPLTTPSATSASTAAAAANTKTPIAQPQPLKPTSNVPSPPVASSSQTPASAIPATEARNDEKPSVVVPSATAAPSVALAPVLPSAPNPNTPTVTPLPPVGAPPVDPNVAVDTRSGVAIAVPTPTALSSSRASLQPTLASPPQSAEPTPRSVANPTPRSTTKPTPQATVSLNSAPATAKPTPATVASRATQASVAPNLPALDIPTTLAAASLAPTPSVTVPPLSTPGSSLNTAPAKPGQPDAALDAPPDGISTSSTSQPSVSVPPPIRVGTPSLAPTIAPPVIEAAPPTSIFSPSGTVVPPVDVPPLQQTPAPTTVQPGAAQTFYDANTVKQPSSNVNLAPPLNSVPLQAPLQPAATAVPLTTPGYDATTIKQPPRSPASVSSVEFGQPLPAGSLAAGVGQPFNGLPKATDGVRQAFKPAAPNVLLPAGTTLNLRYPGNSTLMLSADRPQQEILVLLTELRDGSGNLLAPAGSTVTGRFETTAAGSQFVTQAIVVAGRTVPLVAQSETIDGSRKVEGNNLALNSGIGVLAGGVLGAIGGSVGLGALGGAAAGAATTLLTAPKPATIQPDQVVQVRLTQDLRGAE